MNCARLCLPLCLSLLPSPASPRAAPISGRVLSLDAKDRWLVAADPANAGIRESWWKAPRPDARPIRVPGTMQEVLGDYHGVAWYWLELSIPENPHALGRYVLRFFSVDYAAEVWLNGERVGSGEGADTMFELDVTRAAKPGAKNLLAVRVINPTNVPIDGLVIREAPGRNRFEPWSPGSTYNAGGIQDSVELLITAPVRIEDLYLKPDWKSGAIDAEVAVLSALEERAKVTLELSAAPAASGETLDLRTVDSEIPPGRTVLSARVHVPDFRLWQLEDPVLYRVTARIAREGSDSVDEKSARCGFRDFRFQDGYFRLNGKRIYLKSAHFGGDSPLTGIVPFDRGMVRRDFLELKLMGFNMARCISGLERRHVMDLADEIGLMVYDECFAAWCVSPSPKLAERWLRATAGMILRDRNHPSVVIWGLLNETPNGPVFSLAVESLPRLKLLDDTRVFMLNSGRFDGQLFDAPPGADADRRPELPEAWVLGRGFQVPFVARNVRGADVEYDGTIFPAGSLSLHVGMSGELAVLRFSAPADGEYRVRAEFRGIAGPPAGGPKTTGAVYVLAGSQKLVEDAINCRGRGNETSYEGKLLLRRGQTVGIVSGSGVGAFNSDTTGADVVLVGPDGGVHDAAKDWSIRKGNPNGPWTYGWMPPGEPDPSKFAPFEGTFDGVRKSIGSLSNPGAAWWEDVLADKHPYQPCPHTASVIRTLRTIDGGPRPLFISEYGFGSANNLTHLLGHYDQVDIPYAFDRATLDAVFRRFREDWDRWRLADDFGNMESYFRQCVAMEAMGRLLGTSAIRSNPHVIAHSLTACHDTVLAAEGLITSFREPKPGVHDAMRDAWSPLRFSAFAEPLQVWKGGTAHVEVALVNEDALRPGKYTARIQVLGPAGYKALDAEAAVDVPEALPRPEPPFAKLIFSRDVEIDGPAGTYRVSAFFESGAAAEGGEYTFWVHDPAAMPQVRSAVTLWGEDAELAAWLASRGVRTRRFEERQSEREVILVGRAPGEDFAELARHIARGSAAIFLCPSVFARGDDATALLPLERKGKLTAVHDWLYNNNDWAKRHPIFDGLPTGLMDYQFYREILGHLFWTDQDVPDEIASGMTNTSIGYSSGLTISGYALGEGRFYLNTLLIRENVSSEASHPVAERILRNLLNHAATGIEKPLAELPPDFEERVARMGYKRSGRRRLGVRRCRPICRARPTRPKPIPANRAFGSHICMDDPATPFSADPQCPERSAGRMPPRAEAGGEDHAGTRGGEEVPRLVPGSRISGGPREARGA